MNTIQIQTSGTDLETITLTLTDTEVRNLYESNKDLREGIKNLTKELESAKSTYKYASENRTELQSEVNEANTLLTALGVQEKTVAEPSYYEKQLKLSTRIALYIATNK